MDTREHSAPSWARNLVFAWPRADLPEVLPEVAVYDLACQPTTYDFAAWLVMAKTLGAERVHFQYEGKIQDWKYSSAVAWKKFGNADAQSIAWKRFGNIIAPLCDLMELPWTLGPRRPGFACAYHAGNVNALHAKLGRIAKFPLLDHDDSGYVTITIRESIRNSYRDSNRIEWDKFIAWLDRNGERVILLEDLEPKGQTMDVELRHRIYSNATMNFGVNNGPMALCAYSEAPYLVANYIPEKGGADLLKLMKTGDFGPGTQHSFRNERQLILWEPDNFDNLVRGYASLAERKAA